MCGAVGRDLSGQGGTKVSLPDQLILRSPFSIERPSLCAHPGRPSMFWLYWDSAWSVVISGIMFATIIAHPDAEVRPTWRA
jgi:hypothetical protein